MTQQRGRTVTQGRAVESPNSIAKIEKDFGRGSIMRLGKPATA
jgi:hypothetical protein